MPQYNRRELDVKAREYGFNLTVFNIPRLSVDIDLDFIPNLTREETINEREQLTELLKGI